MVETDRQIDLCSEHAKRPVSVPGLWWCKSPDCGHRIRRSMVEIPSHRSTECRGGNSSADANCPSPPSPHTLDDAASINFAANGGGFTAASRQGLVATC